jgi:cellulose synthase (UDP-forming)
MTILEIWTPLLLTCGMLFLLLEGLGPHVPVARVGASVICTVMTLRYLYWRLLYSQPLHQNLAQHIWSSLFLTVEVGTLISSILVYFFMSRTLSRSAEADAHYDTPYRRARVDIFIATYNEPSDVIERTMVGALAIDHPDLRVWILDDGNRAWVRKMAESLGVHYVARDKGKHAKAGNVNNGVRIAMASDRPPDFFLLLDADFVPSRNILRRALGLFDAEDVGIVQTPQHFFNPDPLQANLLCSSVWPDEQRFFFNVLMPSKDAWGAAFCCGTSAIFRATAFVVAGGMATETVTEDMLTSFKLSACGYRTVFLNERLSLGLAPESILDFISQRARWCLGAIQQIFTRWSFHRQSQISIINRIAFFDTCLYWISGAAFKILLISAPMVYWFTGTTVLRATAAELAFWMVPVFISNLIFMNYLAGNRVLPVMTDITQLLTAFVICRTIVTGLIRPFGRPFKVTSKGLSTTGITVQWNYLWPHALLALLTILGFSLHIARFSPAHGLQGYTANIFWSLFNAAMLTLATVACIEPPHRRRDERFPTSEQVAIRINGVGETSEYFYCTLKDISLGGAAVEMEDSLAEACRNAKENCSLVVYNNAESKAVELPFTIMSRRNKLLTIEFHDDLWIRHSLIRKLFTGNYHREIENISARAVLLNLIHVLIY